MALHIPADWRASAEQILTNNWRKVLVLGATDRGKSTYCDFLVRHIGQSGHKIAFVDADVGQKDVGPPATISLAYSDGQAGLATAELAGMYFVGSTSPARHFLPMVVGTRKMLDTADAPFVTIDTTGLITGSGRVLKAYQIESIQPDVIIALEIGTELDVILNAHRHYPVVRLQSSREAQAKSPGARRRQRELAFQSYFQYAKHITLDLENLIFSRSILFNGVPVEDPRFVYAEQTPDGLLAVRQTRLPEKPHNIYLLTKGFERNRLCGVANQRNDCLGVGIVSAFDFRNKTVTILTPVAEQNISILQFGEMYVDPADFTSGRAHPEHF
jgi:polynucleotide 5'-hydroxyl-kinase GRC3/NOL9